MTVLKIGDIITMAIKDEESGFSFYSALAGKTKNKELKDAFLKMAEQENRHAAKLRGIYDEVGSKAPFEQQSGQYEEYVNALLEMRAFPNPKDSTEKASKISSDIEAVDFSLKIEKETLLLYFELLNFLPDTHKKYIDMIMEEERRHVSELTELREKITP